MRVAFCHPDLGLGGAERLVVDAALELRARGHQVEIFTAHHDPERSFVETHDGRLPPIRVHGDWLPRHLCGRGHALFASLRCLVVCLAMIFSGIAFDAVFVDQVSTVLPVFKWLRSGWKTVFYCHFPDLLLAQREGWLKRLYRMPLDAMEQWTTGWADVILVNSQFTANVFANTFTRLHDRGIRPSVLYPAVQIPSRETLTDAVESWQKELPEDLVIFLTRPTATTFLSINRFERKKNINLAIDALEKLILNNFEEQMPQLIIAGGYDDRVIENREHYEELKKLVAMRHLHGRVYFLRSFTDRQKHLLLAAAAAVVYTPSNEHFGIVPLESMAFERPVIACNSGGPVESIEHGQTGFLAAPTPDAFAEAMQQLMSQQMRQQMGINGRTHVEEKFSRLHFGQELVAVLEALLPEKRSRQG